MKHLLTFVPTKKFIKSNTIRKNGDKMSDDRVECKTYKVEKGGKPKYYEVCVRPTGETDANGVPIVEVVSDRPAKVRSRF